MKRAKERRLKEMKGRGDGRLGRRMKLEGGKETNEARTGEKTNEERKGEKGEHGLERRMEGRRDTELSAW